MIFIHDENTSNNEGRKNEKHVRFLRMQIYSRIKKKTLEKITFDNYLPLMKTALKMKVVVVDSHLIEQLIHFREKYYREQKLTETEQFYSQIYRHSIYIRKRDISITNDDDDDDDERVIVGRAISEQ